MYFLKRVAKPDFSTVAKVCDGSPEFTEVAFEGYKHSSAFDKKLRIVSL